MSAVQIQTDSKRLVRHTDEEKEDLDPLSTEQKKQIQETNSIVGSDAESNIKPANEKENPLDVDGKELTDKDNTIEESTAEERETEEKEYEHEEEKQVYDDIVDEDHEKQKFYEPRASMMKPKMSKYSHEK